MHNCCAVCNPDPGSPGTHLVKYTFECHTILSPSRRAFQTLFPFRVGWCWDSSNNNAQHGGTTRHTGPTHDFHPSVYYLVITVALSYPSDPLYLALDGLLKRRDHQHHCLQLTFRKSRTHFRCEHRGLAQRYEFDGRAEHWCWCTSTYNSNPLPAHTQKWCLNAVSLRCCFKLHFNLMTLATTSLIISSNMQWSVCDADAHTDAEATLSTYILHILPHPVPVAL